MTRTLRVLALLAGLLLVVGCTTTPAYIAVPDNADNMQFQTSDANTKSNLAQAERVMPGDTVRIIRDAMKPAEDDDMTLYLVRNDGAFNYPFVGRVDAAGKTPDQISDFISGKLASIYREPHVTVNIAIAPSNKIYVGGAVRNPGAFDLTAGVSLAQALTATGGILPTADAAHVALLRLNDAGNYQVHFVNYATLLSGNGASPVALQRGDLIFVPQSQAGQAADAVNLYMNQLVPFTKSVGVGYTWGKLQQ